MKIRIYPDPALRKKSAPVAEITPQIRSILKEMADTMYLASGIGLAGPQVGISKQIIVLDVGKGLLCLINPVVLKRWGKSFLEEGCLSLPGVTVKVGRSAKVKVRALNEEGKTVELEGEGLLAHALQHEIDHLHGRLIIDYVNFAKRWQIKRKLGALAAKQREPEEARCSVEAKCI